MNTIHHSSTFLLYDILTLLYSSSSEELKSVVCELVVEILIAVLFFYGRQIILGNLPFQFRIMLKVKDKTNFQDIWLENKEYEPWLQKVENNLHVVRCKVFAKAINIAAHGIRALNIHAKGLKHK